MKNFKLTIEYDGSRYCGWQIQNVRQKHIKKPSIQQTITLCLEKNLDERIDLIGSGRTDSGVHALGQIAHFKSNATFSIPKMKSFLNGVLPKDIRVLSFKSAPLDFHARYSARSKVYRYHVQNQLRTSAFLQEYSYWYKFPLNLALMRRAADYFIGKHDFKSFCASRSSVKNTVRTIERLTVGKKSLLGVRMICFDIEASGFLYNMVRNIVGTLLDVGRGRFSPNDIKRMLRKRNRSLAGPCVPAKGLFLVKVHYDS